MNLNLEIFHMFFDQVRKFKTDYTFPGESHDYYELTYILINNNGINFGRYDGRWS